MITFGHIALRVEDIDAMLNFYIKGLGFAEAFRIFNDDGSLRIVFLHIAEGKMLELCVGGESRPEFDDISSIGFRHLSFVVENIEQSKTQLESNGVKFDSEILILRDKNKTAFLFDPDGNKLELVEITKDSPHYKFLNNL